MDSTSKQIDSSYSVPSLSSTPRWNVFLSFRGDDTRKNFTGHLYSALDRAGIRTFMDDPELPRGDDISSGLLKAVQESKLSIVVFSKNYAFSTWCLTELVKILECKRTMKHLVLPVFYNVHPSEVRNQIGSFAEAFEKHKKRFVTDMDKVDMWRVALAEAGNLSGYHIDENGHETKIIQDIVSKVVLEVNPRYLNVAKHPVGIKSRVEHIYPLLTIGSNSVRRIGIYGMGGVGKSTMAKAVYNDIIHCFEGTCFIENVREFSKQHYGLVSLQKQLVWDILKIKENISNVDEGISLIEQRLCSKKILIVLDDVDHRSQAYSLAGEWNRFAPGSRIIITTRDAGVLNQIGVDERYNIEGLEKEESLVLFSWHAFRKPTPLENYKKISEDIVHYTAGLPLALEVLGSYLYTRTLEEWRGSFKKLQQIPRNEIREKLIISFDALGGGSLKDIFLDIACFFIGMDKFEAINILNSCGYDSENEIIILVERCLLSINDKNEIRMHDLLRDMGREIVNNMFPEEPEKRSRLWSTGDICNVLKNGKGTEAIQGIIPDSPYIGELQKVPLNTETFERMRRLRLLNINTVTVAGNFRHIFEELRWLSWHNCPLQCLPSDFHPQKLVILDLRFSKFSILWHSILFLEQLKILNLSRCEFLKTTPDFTGVPCIEKLLLGGCKSLVEVHPSIGSLGSLVNLDLWGCENLRILPSSICNLRTLECFDLRGCSNLEGLPEELGNIESLRVFNASKIAIKKLPDSIGRLTKLNKLDLSYCRNLRTLPSSICNLKVLECLYLYGCSTLEGLQEELGNIESLRVFNASKIAIKKLPDSIGRLTKLNKLDLSYCRNLRILPSSICNLKVLECLYLYGCSTLEGLPEELGNIESLRVLWAAQTSIKKLPDSIGRLTEVVELVLSDCKNLINLPSSIYNLRMLESLYLSRCSNMKGLPEEFGNLESLRKLLAQQTMIRKLPDSIGRLNKLFELNLRDCKNIKKLPSSICNLRALERLNLEGCSNLEELPEELGKIESLKELRAGKTNLTKIPDSIGHMKNLEILALPALTRRSLLLRSPFHYVAGFLQPSICGLCSLKELNLRDCFMFDRDIPDNIGSLSSLEILDLSENYFCNLPSSLSRLSNLKLLYLRSSQNLQSLSELPPKLEQLVATDSRAMTKLVNLSKLKNLKHLDLTNCRSLVEIHGLKNLSSIQEIHMGDCNKLTNTFTESFFQIYSEFGKEIDIFLPRRKIPNWFSHQRFGSTIYFVAPWNVPNSFLGMILWVVSLSSGTEAVIENRTNGTKWTHSTWSRSSEVHSWVSFIPKMFSVNSADRIKVSFRGDDAMVERCGVHLVYKSDMIEI